MPTTLTTQTIASNAPLIRARQLSPVELVDAHLEVIAAVDPELRAFITVTAEQARHQAAETEQEIAAGHYRGPLHGIPVAVKDNIESAGVRTTGGSIFLDDYIPSESAVSLQKLEQAGAILLGKLNMHEWAISVTTDNPFYGRCLNPRNLTRIPGGSSGGSAAALAAGLCMGSLGTDTGGSVRLPAALCGVVGFKPTFGRVSRRGVLPLSYSLDHVGPMARTVLDTALLYHAVAGYDAADPYSVEEEPGDELDRFNEEARAHLAGLRVALATREFDREGKRPDSDVTAIVMEAAQKFEAMGATVRPVVLPEMGEVGRANSAMLVTEAADYHAERLAGEPEKFSSYMRAALERGRDMPGVRYAHARQFQAEIRRRMDLFFDDFDLLITPTCPVPPPFHDESEADQNARMWLVAYTAPFNFTGNPAISVPCGYTPDGLPVGMQIIGDRGADWSVLRAAHAFESG